MKITSINILKTIRRESRLFLEWTRTTKHTLGWNRRKIECSFVSGAHQDEESDCRPSVKPELLSFEFTVSSATRNRSRNLPKSWHGNQEYYEVRYQNVSYSEIGTSVSRSVLSVNSDPDQVHHIRFKDMTSCFSFFSWRFHRGWHLRHFQSLLAFLHVRVNQHLSALK